MMNRLFKFLFMVIALLGITIDGRSQTLAITSVSPNPICIGSTVTVQFTRTTMPNASVETAELSDNAGSFAAPTSLGTYSAGGATGTITGAIPAVTPGNGYLIRITSTHVPAASPSASSSITISANVGTPAFTLGATSNRCQAAGTVNYAATATNASGITYTLDATSLGAGNSINGATGDVTYVAGWTGASTITASAAGCNGPLTATHVATTNASVGTPAFALGGTSTRCQAAGTVNYGATATNNTGLTYTLDATSLGAGNSINGATGDVTYVAGWNGTSTITVSAAGCNGPTTANHIVTITPTVGTPAFTLGATSSRCQGAGTVNYAATASNTSGITYTLDATSLGAGNTINGATGDVTYVAAWTGTSTITASAAGCNGPTTANHVVTITTTVGTPVFTLGGTSTRCQGAGTVNYGATATNSSSITYTLDATSLGAGNSINATTGVVTYVAGWSGTSTITASAAGCNGPTTANHVVTITPTVGGPVFTLGGTSTRCQGAGNVTYTATSTNNTGITYSLDGTSLGAGNTIVAATGVVTYVAGYSGTAIISATATGCNGPSIGNHVVTITPTVGTPIFTLGATSTRCQGAGLVTYTANATNNTGITYTLDATSLGAGNTIVAGTGAVTYVAGYSGSSTITASATGCNGPKTSTHTVTITPTVGTPIFTLGATSTRCQGAGSVAYGATATNNTGITYSLDATSLANGNTIVAGTGAVTYAANWNGTSTITASASGCNGPSTATHTVTIVGIPVFSLGASSTRCQGFSILTYTATAVNSTGITYSLTTTPASASGINSSNGAVSYDPGLAGTAVITATAAGCITPLVATHNVTVVSGVGTPSFGAASPTACQGSTVSYAATATNNTGITYSIATNPAAGASINTSTGSVTYNAGFTGSAIITAIATGCGPSTSATQSVVITPVVTQPVFNAGPASTICQALVSPVTTVTYTATASNIISPLVYSVSPVAAGTLNTATGQLTYSPTFTGNATISVLATGCNGTLTSNFPVSVTPSVGVPSFVLGSSSVRKQGSGNTTYTANVGNGTLSYSLSPAAAGNIVPTTGSVTFSPAFSGTATITAVAAGCNTTAASTITHNVTVVQTPIFSLGATSTRCQGAGTVTYTATSSNGTVSYTLSTSPVDPLTTINASTGVVTYSSTFSGTATISAVSTNGLVVTDIATHVVTVNIAPRLTTPTPSSKTICSGTNTLISLVATTGAGSSYAWTLAGGANTTGQSANTLSVINQTLTNIGHVNSDSLYYIVTVTSPSACPSVIKDSIKVIVNPTPVLNTIAPTTVCSQTNINISLGASAPSTFTWTINNSSKITGATSSGGSLINQLLVNTDSSAAPTSGFVTYRILPTSLNGCAGNLDSTTVTVNPLPRVTFGTGNSVTRCSGQSTAINLTANISSSFAYSTGTLTSLGLVSGNSAGTGSSINQVLNNSSNLLQDSIYYTVTPTTVSIIPTCVGVPKTVVVTVNPLPSLTSTLTDSVCSQGTTNTPLTATLPSTYSWALGTNTGGITGQIANASSSAVTSINQSLFNPSFTTAGFVQYIVTPTTVSLPNCVGASKTVTVKVNPLPQMTSAATQTICSDSILTYQIVSSTGGSSVYTYTRSSNDVNIPFIPAKAPASVSQLIVDTLSTHFIYTPKTANYLINLTSASNCVFNSQPFTVTVNPTPATPGISIFPPASFCDNMLDQNFGAARIPDPSERYVWSGPSVIQRSDSTRYALISFPSQGTKVVSVYSHAVGFTCPSLISSKAFTVNPSGGSVNPNVVFFADNLICQGANITLFQWGFDKKADLDSVIIPGATTQNLYVGSGSGFDPASNYYWVMASFSDGCVRKAYYNDPPLAVNPVKTFVGVPVKVYPNPVLDAFTVELPNMLVKDLQIEVFDLSGRLMQTSISQTAKTVLSAASLVPGYYVVICSHNGQRIATTRFIKQ